MDAARPGLLPVVACAQDTQVERLDRDQAVGQGDLYLPAAAGTSRITDEQRRRRAGTGRGNPRDLAARADHPAKAEVPPADRSARRLQPQGLKEAAGQLADLWEADRDSAAVHLPDLRGYLHGLSKDSLLAATRPLAAVPLPRTREFPDWTPRPPQPHPAIEAENGLLFLDD